MKKRRKQKKQINKEEEEEEEIPQVFGFLKILLEDATKQPVVLGTMYFSFIALALTILFMYFLPFTNKTQLLIFAILGIILFLLVQG